MKNKKKQGIYMHVHSYHENKTTTKLQLSNLVIALKNVSSVI